MLVSVLQRYNFYLKLRKVFSTTVKTKCVLVWNLFFAYFLLLFCKMNEKILYLYFGNVFVVIYNMLIIKYLSLW